MLVNCIHSQTYRLDVRFIYDAKVFLTMNNTYVYKHQRLHSVSLTSVTAM